MRSEGPSVAASALTPPPQPAAPDATIADFTERELIDQIARQLPASPGWLLVGIGDDAAVVEPERNRLEVLSVDALVEGVHFDRRVTPPTAIGHRALAVNLSDLAAMGASPRLALLSMALPPTLPWRDFDAMIAGLVALAGQHGMHLVGGNLTRSPGPLALDVTVLGTLKRRHALTRAGARAGDEIYVTGSIGAAAVGLQKLSCEGGRPTVAGDDACVQRYLYPDPRVRAGVLLGRNRAATAAIDLSDGAADGVRRIAESSSVGAIIEAGLLPIDPGARAWWSARGLDPIMAALAGGDDYELLFTVRPRLRRRLGPAGRHGGAPLTRIGVCTAEPTVSLRGRIGDPSSDGPLPPSYTHFG